MMRDFTSMIDDIKDFKITKMDSNNEISQELEIITVEDLRNEILLENELQALDTFKKEHPELCKDRDDLFLIFFIWGRKLDLKRAAELLQNHYNWRTKYDIDNLNYEWVKEFLSANITVSTQVGGVDCFDKKGRMVNFLFPKHLADNETLAKDKDMVKKMMHFQWYTLEKIFHQKKYIKHFREGIVIIEDFSNVKV